MTTKPRRAIRTARSRGAVVRFVFLLFALSVACLPRSLFDAAGASAQPSASQPGRNDGSTTAATTVIRILESTPSVGPDGEYAVRLAVPTDRAGTVTTEIYERLVHPGEVDPTLKGRSLGRREYRLADQEWDQGSTSVVIRMPVSRTPTGGRFRLDEGIYTVVLAVTPDGSSATTLITHLVHVPVVVAARPVALLLQPDVAPQYDMLQPALSDADHRLLVGLQQLLSANEASPPVFVELKPATVELFDSTNGTADRAVSKLADALVSARHGAGTLATTLVDLRSGEWLRGGLGRELGLQFDAGASRTAGAGRDIKLLDQSDDDAVIDLMTSRGVTTFLLDKNRSGVSLEQPQSTSAEEPVRLYSIVRVSRPHRILTTIEPTSPRSGAIAADDLLTRLKQLSFGRVPLDVTIPAVVVLNRDQSSDHAFVDELRAGITASELLRPLRTEDWSKLLALPSQPLRRTPAAPLADASMVDAAVRLSQLANSVTKTFGSGHPAKQLLDEQLLLAGDQHLTSQQRLAVVETAISDVSRQVIAVDVPRETSITVTAHSSTIPLSLRNLTNQDLDIEVQLSSSELSLSRSATSVVHLGPSATVPFEVPIRTSRAGDFRVTITVHSLDQLLTLSAPATIDVHSSAVSGLGIALSLGALLVLTVWWIRNARHRPHSTGRDRLRQRLADRARLDNPDAKACTEDAPLQDAGADPGRSTYDTRPGQPK